MNILITGAGLIGSNAARHAVDAGHQGRAFRSRRPIAITSKKSSAKTKPASSLLTCAICRRCLQPWKNSTSIRWCTPPV